MMILDAALPLLQLLLLLGRPEPRGLDAPQQRVRADADALRVCVCLRSDEAVVGRSCACESCERQCVRVLVFVSFVLNLRVGDIYCVFPIYAFYLLTT